MDKKKYNVLIIYFIEYFHSKSIKVVNLYYHKLMGRIEEHEENNYLMNDGYMLNKVLDFKKQALSILMIIGF